MRKLITHINRLILAGLMLTSSVVGAQQVPGRTGSYPLTSDRNYTFGIAPSSANHADAVNAYNEWKQTYVSTDCGDARVIFDFFPGGKGSTDRSETVSEGIAYGMLLSAYAGDRSLFNGLWSFYKRYRNENGIMNWKIKNCNVREQNGATDAELDVAMALIVASFQWQSDSYENDARNMIRIIREKEFDGSVLKPGDKFGGRNLTNPSYFSPAYYEVYKDYDPGQDAFWDAAIAKGYEIIDKADKNDLGLVPDWVDENGNTTSAASQYEDGGKNFLFDAIRTPFRSAIDYLWHGRAEAKTYCGKLINWSNNVHNGGTEALQSAYRINGQSLGGGHSNTFVGCFAVAAMTTNNQSYLNRGYADNQNTIPGNGQYFNATFKVLANFVMSGNFYLPPPDACSGPSLGNDKSLCSGNPVQLNAGISANSYEWRRNGNKINGATSRTYNAASAGEYEVITNQDGCVRRDKIVVGAASINADFIALSSAGGVAIENTSTGGISSYSWSVDQGTTNITTSTEKTPEFTGLAAGQYDVTLTVSNSGFSGCNATDDITKTISVGSGEGVAMDDFNGLFDKGINVYFYGPDGTDGSGNFEAFPKTWCSRQDQIDGNPQFCTDFRCSYIDLECKGATANWATLEFAFMAGAGAPFNLTNGAFVAVKMSASEPVSVNVHLGQDDFLATPFKADLTTSSQVFTFDFTNVLTGSDGTGAATTIANWDETTKLAFRPYASDLTYTGTISIDYIIVGAKALDAPTFDIRKDEFGFTDFSNYLPNYFPNDPQYANCTPSTATGCYGAVPDWEREVFACGPTATIEAKSCLASEIRWYNGSTLVETGDVATLAPGDYTIELIGPGGVTTDNVTVTGRDLKADFVVDRLNYDATFINKSTDFDTFEWNYGDPANDLPNSTIWEVGYHNYQTAGDGTYNVSLTVMDTVCKTTDVAQQQLMIACDQLTGEIIVKTSTETGCEGDEVLFEIEKVENANTYGWFPPEGTTIVLAEDSLSGTVTFGSTDGPLTIEAYNACSAAPLNEKSSKEVMLNLAGKPVGTFVLAPTPDGGFTAEATADAPEQDDETYAWTFGDGNSGTGATVAHTYDASLKGIAQTICLTVTNRCEVSDEECDSFTPLEPVGITELNGGSMSMFPTLATENIVVELNGTAYVTVSDVLGNTVSETVISNRGDIDVADLSAGMYILTVEQGGEVVNKRFIKE